MSCQGNPFFSLKKKPEKKDEEFNCQRREIIFEANTFDFSKKQERYNPSYCYRFLPACIALHANP